MHDFLVSNIQPVLWVITGLEILFIVLFAGLYKRTKKTVVLCMLLTTVGLVADASLIALGGVVGEIPLFLARLRFIFHGALVPLIFPICGYGLKLGKRAMSALWVFTALVMVLGIAHAFGVDLVTASVGANIRHTSSAMTPEWAEAISRLLSFGTVIPLIISGVVVWIRFKNQNLFFSGLLMFVFAALGPATGNMDLLFVISMFGELFMVLFYYLYVIKNEKLEENNKSEYYDEEKAVS